MNLQVQFPQCMSMAYVGDMYGFDALPIPKSAGMELLCQTLWQPFPT